MSISLKAQEREILGKKVKKLREQGLVPAEVYGRGFDNIHLSVPMKEFNDVLKEAGESTVVNLLIADKQKPVLIHNIQKHPVTDEVLAVDFYQVHLDEKTEVAVSVEMVGESPAVKEKDGVLLQILNEVTVEALPNSIPRSIEVDISGLEEIDQAIHVSDLKVEKDVKILNEPEAVVVTIQAKMTEEEEEELKGEPTDVSEVEVEGEKEEEEEKENEEE